MPETRKTRALAFGVPLKVQDSRGRLKDLRLCAAPNCYGWIPADKRSDSIYCSGACRTAACRARHAPEPAPLPIGDDTRPGRTRRTTRESLDEFGERLREFQREARSLAYFAEWVWHKGATVNELDRWRVRAEHAAALADLVHGTLGSGDDPREQIEALKKEYRVSPN